MLWPKIKTYKCFVSITCIDRAYVCGVFLDGSDVTRLLQDLKIIKRTMFICIWFKSFHGLMADGENYFRHKMFWYSDRNCQNFLVIFIGQKSHPHSLKPVRKCGGLWWFYNCFDFFVVDRKLLFISEGHWPLNLCSVSACLL